MLLVLSLLLSTTHSYSLWRHGRPSSLTSSRSSAPLTRFLASIMSQPQERTNITEIPRQNLYNLTGIICGDDWECEIPYREFGTAGGISYNGPSSHQVLLRWITGPNRYSNKLLHNTC